MEVENTPWLTQAKTIRQFKIQIAYVDLDRAVLITNTSRDPACQSAAKAGLLLPGSLFPLITGVTFSLAVGLVLNQSQK